MTSLRHYKSIEEFEDAVIANREDIKNLSEKFENIEKPKGEIDDKTTEFEKEFYGIEKSEDSKTET